MESPSEDDFLWTEASSDSSNGLKAVDKIKKPSDKCVTDNIKLHKNKTKAIQNGSNGQDITSYHESDENILEVKVKKEKSINEYSKKNKKIKLESPSDLDIIPKKKKKAKYKNLSDDQINSKYKCDGDYSDMEVKQELTDEQTVEDYHMSNQNFRQNSKITDESSGDEISAIKGDDTHSLHTTLFENSERKSRDSDSDKSIDKNNFRLSQTKHRTQKMSDRLQFEDEYDLDKDSISTDHCIKQYSKMKSSKIKLYLKENVGLKQVNKGLDRSNIITHDDEIWLMRCPNEIKIEAFEGIHFKQGGKCKVKINGQSYETVIKEEDRSMVTILSLIDTKYHLVNFPLPGTINLRRRIPKQHVHENNTIVNNQTNFIPLPETKCRHPLFGLNYKKALKVPNAIAERLSINDNNNKQYSLMPEKKKRETKEKNAKKKRKLINTDDASPAPKKKCIKHDLESVEAWDSEKAIEENLFNF